MFFHSWELWEQMTFVLALAIIGVIVVGYTKLLWRNRLVQRQELVDEEKRTRIQQLRNNGQIVESRKSTDIPFGIRAIQSGIQVEGIWISRTTTPIPSQLKLGHLRGSTSDYTPVESSKDVETSEYSNGEVLRPLSRAERSSFRNVSLNSIHQVQDSKTGRPNSAGVQSAYKARTASHLRYGSYGIYDEETLGQLEGKAPQKGKARAHQPRGSRNLDTEGESSSAADNDRSSNASFESDSTISHKARLTSDPTRQGLLSEMSSTDIASLSLSTVTSARPVNIVQPPQTSRAEYVTIPIESPNDELSDPFATPFMSPLESPEMKPQYPTMSAQPTWLDGPQYSVPGTRSTSPFVPGELHVNKSVRKVNSGFEVLPAGTFGGPKGSKNVKSMDHEHSDDAGEKRQPGKLQKKPRSSMGGRPSSTFERA